MKIGILTPFEESVPPQKYGGTELVIYNLIEQLVKIGHDVTLLASGDSKTSAKLVPVFNTSIRAMQESQDQKFRESLKYIGIAKDIQYLQENKFDVIHNHIGWRILPFENIIKLPMVTTFHGPLDIPYQQLIYNQFSKSNFISISLNQRKPMPHLHFIANVYNGIEVEKFKFNDTPKDYFAFLGRMSPEKGPVEAIQVAKKAGVKLIMAAKVDAVDTSYFKEKVEPLIDGKQIQFIGEVDHAGKVELLSNALGLIAPIQWEEPFGLYFVEAMACGTPAISINRGSVPELIINGQTGFVCKDTEEMAEAVGKIQTITRKTCREHVEKNFSSVVMTKNYLEAYSKAIENFK